MAIFPGSTDSLDAKIWAELAAALQPKYQLIKPLGQGGMGAVLLAREEALDRVVAIKVLAPALAADDEFRLRFEAEGRAAAAISHPNVVQVYTVGETAGSPPLPFIILQYVAGEPLDQWLERAGPLPERPARRLLRDIAAGLAAAHERNLVHLDVKPGNVLVERPSGRALLVDFGLAAAVSARTPNAPRLVAGGDNPRLGTTLYMSPEQLLGEPVGPPSDVFSFGLLAAEVLAGPIPTGQGSPVVLVRSRLASPVPSLAARRPGLAPDLIDLVQRCLNPDPTGRPAAAELARALLPSLDEGVAWPPPGLGDLAGRAGAVRRIAVVTIAGIVLLALATAAKLPGTHTAHGWWRAWGDGSLVVSAASGPPNSVVVLWHVVMLLGLALGCGGLAFFSGRGLRLARDLGAARRHGWRRRTLTDAMADPDGRTGQVLGATADFAALSHAARRRVVACRVAGLVSPLIGLSWLLICLSWWAIGMLAGSPPAPLGGPLIGTVGLTVLLLPVFTAAGAGALAAMIERRSIGSIPWRRFQTATFPVSAEARPEDVAGWYRDLGIEEPRVDRLVPRARVRGGVLAVVWVIGVAFIGAGLVGAFAATLVSARVARQIGSETARAAALYQRGGVADLNVDLSDLLPSSSARPSADDRLIQDLLENRLPSFPLDPRLALGSPESSVARKALIAEAVRRARLLSPDSIARLTEFKNHPRTRALRELAGQPIDSRSLDVRSLTALRRALEANAAAAVVAAASSQFDSARRRLGENYKIAGWMASGPNRIAAESGLLALETTALLPLAELERAAGREGRAAVLANAARGAAEQAARYGPGWSIGVLGLAADPRDMSEFEAILADTRIPRGYRSSMAEGFLDAQCLRPRYLLLGERSTFTSVRAPMVAEGTSKPWWRRLRDCYDMGE